MYMFWNIFYVQKYKLNSYQEKKVRTKVSNFLFKQKKL